MWRIDVRKGEGRSNRPMWQRELLRQISIVDGEAHLWSSSRVWWRQMIYLRLRQFGLSRVGSGGPALVLSWCFCQPTRPHLSWFFFEKNQMLVSYAYPALQADRTAPCEKESSCVRSASLIRCSRNMWWLSQLQEIKDSGRKRSQKCRRNLWKSLSRSLCVPDFL